MKKIEIILGGKTYAAAMFTLGEYKKVARICADAQRAAGNIQEMIPYYDAVAELVHASAARAGHTGTVQELIDAATPAELLMAMGLIARESALVEIPAIGVKVN